MTVLCWIKNKKIGKQCVQYCVEEIRNLTTKDSWKRPGDVNPANIPSHVLKAKELSINCTWWNGPTFLCRTESELPKPQSNTGETELALQEAVKKPPEVIHSLVDTSIDQLKQEVDEVIDIERF